MHRHPGAAGGSIVGVLKGYGIADSGGIPCIRLASTARVFKRLVDLRPANIVALARWLSHTCSLMLQSSQLPANCLRVLHSSQMVNSVESTGVHSTE